MPFAVIALVLSAFSLGGYALATSPSASSSLCTLSGDTLEIIVVGVVATVGLVLMLVPGALVRVLYGSRPPLPGALTAEERAMTRFDREERARLASGDDAA